MKIYDISMNINPNMMVYKNNPDKAPKITVKSSFVTSSSYESNLSIDLHTGTHIDAPLHMIKDGNMIEEYPLDKFIRIAKVLDLTNVTDKITALDLQIHNIAQGDFILLKTKNSISNTFNFNFIYVDELAAKYLASKNIAGVGIDSLGIERNQPNHETHKVLLEKGIVILEGLRLKDIDAKSYTLICLPLKIDSVEASPVRAVLIDNL